MILIVLDTVRAMDLHLCGYERPTTPFLADNLPTVTGFPDRSVAEIGGTFAPTAGPMSNARAAPRIGPVATSRVQAGPSAVRPTTWLAALGLLTRTRLGMGAVLGLGALAGVVIKYMA
mgnify:CR=1 FL=1